MKVKVTKSMYKELNKALKNQDATSIYEFQFVNLNPNWNFDLDDTDLHLDNEGNWVCYAIKVVYKDECYAMPNYISTADLRNIFKKYNCDGYYLEQFLNNVIDEYEV